MFKVPTTVPKKRPRGDQPPTNEKRARTSTSASSSSSSSTEITSPFGANEIVSLKKAIKDLKKQTDINLEKREKYPNDPQQWMESEVRIDICLKQLQNLATDTKLYDTFVDNDGVSSVAQLLLHDNMDVVLDVIDLLIEFTEYEEENFDDMGKLLDALFENDIIQILIGLLTRGEEGTKLERSQQSLILQIIENLHSWDPKRTSQASILSQKTKFFCDWLLAEVSKTDCMDEFHSYVCEILAIFAATPPVHFEESMEDEAMTPRLIIGQYCDNLLQKINYFRKHTPRTMEEEEILENIFDCLCSCLMEKQIQTLFRNLEGLELLVILTRENAKIRRSAIKALSYALLNNEESCNRFMTIKGYKTLFAVLMKLNRGTKKKEKSKKSKGIGKEEEAQLEEHVISILVSLFTHTTGEDRKEHLKILISKFSEKNFEKTECIMELLIKYYTKVYIFDQKVESGIWDQELANLELDPDQREQLIFMERLSEGLFIVQRLCIIIAFLYQDEAIRNVILSKLSQYQIPLPTVIDILQYYHDNIGDKDTDQLSSEQQAERELIQSLLSRLANTNNVATDNTSEQ
jgi:beta-catenin-like protein 1